MIAAAPMLEDSLPVGPDELFAERVRTLVAERCGFAPRPAAMQNLRIALTQRRAGRTNEEYWQLLQSSSSSEDELQQLVEDLLNHNTECGRTPPHFEVLRQRVLPALASVERTVRFASLGCSTGEEAYSLALTAVEAFGTIGGPAVEIVGLDLSQRALAVARAGVYPASSLRELTAAQRERGFVRQSDGFHVRPEISRLVRFAQHNLMSPLPLVGVDAIFCRNVLIYFSPTSANLVLGHIRDALAPRGWLFLGPTEAAPQQREWFEPVIFAETLTYRRR